MYIYNSLKKSNDKFLLFDNSVNNLVKLFKLIPLEFNFNYP